MENLELLYEQRILIYFVSILGIVHVPSEIFFVEIENADDTLNEVNECQEKHISTGASDNFEKLLRLFAKSKGCMPLKSSKGVIFVICQG